ncbi:MAG TPA: hypothetical protein VGK67_29565 [Myxococcales bacterium]|jgi:hypothetical protein
MTERLATLAALLGLFACACSPTAVTLEVEPSRLSFTSSGDTVILITNLSDKEGKTIVKHDPCVFVTSDPLVVEVRQDGTVKANNSGKGEIRVQCNKLTAKIPVKVSLPAKVTIEAACETRCTQLTADPLILKLEGVGASAKLTARVLDDAGEPVGVEQKWEVSDPDYRAGTRRMGVELGKEGELHSLGIVGKYLVLVTAGNIVARGSVEVTLPNVDIVKAQPRVWLAPNSSGQIEPEAFERSKHGLKPIAGASFTYTSNNPTVAKVGNDGKLTAISIGITDVVVAAENGTAFSSVEVAVAEEDPWAKPPPPAPKPKPKQPKKK